ncbi:MAG: T9SS type A sorting domain-containing protein [Bacteroidia bacterium]|nr:T9SS type A sorting domain-containing protein [Bacteroidia bacterium]
MEYANDTTLYVASPFTFSPGLGDTNAYSLSWNFDFGTFSEEPNPEILFPEPGLYTVSLQLTDSLDHRTWIFQNFIFLDSTISDNYRLQKGENNESVFIYPNPCKDYLFIPCDKCAALELYSISGELLEFKAVTPEITSFDMRNYSPGIYLLKLIGTNETHMMKVIRND